MTYFAKKTNENGTHSAMAYFDTYSGKPMMNYPYAIRIDVKKDVADGLDSCIISVYKANSVYCNCDAMLISHMEHKTDIELRIMRIARAALYEKNAESKDNIANEYNPKRDFRVRKPYSNESAMEDISESDIAEYMIRHSLISEE